MRRLIIRPGAIGDCILALPAMEHLRTGYTEVWVASQNVPLIRLADRVRGIASTGLDMVGIPGVEPPAGTMRLLESFDSVVSWYGAAREEFRTAVAGLPFTFFQALPGAPGMHAADWFLKQAGGCGPAAPRLDCARSDGGFAVIHPFSGSPRKNWPLERFRDLASLLPMPVRWCAGPEEDLEDTVRFNDLWDLACWLASASLYVGNDSGITHLAAAAGAPVIALFGPTDPAIWAPRGPQVSVIAAPDGRMDAIDVDEVEAACMRSASCEIGRPAQAANERA